MFSIEERVAYAMQKWCASHNEEFKEYVDNLFDMAIEDLEMEEVFAQAIAEIYDELDISDYARDVAADMLREFL